MVPTTSLGLPPSLLANGQSSGIPHSIQQDARQNSDILSSMQDRFRGNAPANYVTQSNQGVMANMMQSGVPMMRPLNGPNKNASNGTGLRPPTSIGRYYQTKGSCITGPDKFRHPVDIGQETILGMPPYCNQSMDIMESIDLDTVETDDISNVFIEILQKIGDTQIYKETGDQGYIKERRHGVVLVPKDYGIRRGNIQPSALLPSSPEEIMKKRMMRGVHPMSLGFSPQAQQSQQAQNSVQQFNQPPQPYQHQLPNPMPNQLQNIASSTPQAQSNPMTPEQMRSMMQQYQPHSSIQKPTMQQLLMYQNPLENQPPQSTPFHQQQLLLPNQQMMSPQQLQQHQSQMQQYQQQSIAQHQNGNNPAALPQASSSQSSESQQKQKSSSSEGDEDEDGESSDDESNIYGKSDRNYRKQKKHGSKSKEYLKEKLRQKEMALARKSSKKPSAPISFNEYGYAMAGGQTSDSLIGPMARKYMEDAEREERYKIVKTYKLLQQECSDKKLSSLNLLEPTDSLDKYSVAQLTELSEDLKTDILFDRFWTDALQMCRFGTQATVFANEFVGRSYLDLDDKASDPESSDDDDFQRGQKKKRRRQRNESNARARSSDPKKKPFVEAMNDSLSAVKWDVRRMWEENGKSLDFSIVLQLAKKIGFGTADRHMSRTLGIEAFDIKHQNPKDALLSVGSQVASTSRNDDVLASPASIPSGKRYMDDRRRREEYRDQHNDDDHIDRTESNPSSDVASSSGASSSTSSVPIQSDTVNGHSNQPSQSQSNIGTEPQQSSSGNNPAPSSSSRAPPSTLRDPAAKARLLA